MLSSLQQFALAVDPTSLRAELDADLAQTAADRGAGLPAALLLAKAHTARNRFEEANDTLEQKVATGFHRNTLTNKEGGVDQEQFRVEAVVDRVSTTAKVWLGITLNCSSTPSPRADSGDGFMAGDQA